jgi:hypothetical protein
VPRLERPGQLYRAYDENVYYYEQPETQWMWSASKIDNDPEFRSAFAGETILHDHIQYSAKLLEEWLSETRRNGRVSEWDGKCRRCYRVLPITLSNFRPQHCYGRSRNRMLCRACEFAGNQLSKAVAEFINPRKCPDCGNDYPFTAKFWPSPWSALTIYGNNGIVCLSCYEALKNERADAFAHIGRAERRARVMNAEGTYTPDDLKAIRAAQTDRRGRLICWACEYPIIGDEPPPHRPNGARLPPHLDHWIPLRHGGRNDAGNLHYMHGVCNLSKSDKMPAELGRLL